MANQGDHDLRLHVNVLLLERDGGLDDGPHLHLDDLGEKQPKANATQAEHRVLLAHALDRAQQRLLRLQLLLRRLLHTHGRHFDQLLVVVGQEFVQRRVDQPDDDRQTVHLLEDADEIRALERQQLAQPLAALFLVRGQDHLLHERQPLLLHEHVLGAAEADPLRAVIAGNLGIARVVGVGPDPEPAAGIGPGQQLIEILVDGRLDHWHRAQDHLPGRAVDRDQVALFDSRAVDRENPLIEIDPETFGARHTGLAHAAGHHGGVTRLAAARRQHALGGDHPVHVIRVGFDPHQDHGLALLAALLGPVGIEDGPAAGGARGSIDALGDHLGLRLRIDARMQQLVDLRRLDALNGLVLSDELFVDHIDRDLDGGLGGPLGGASLQHPELALLDGELEILDVAVMLLQPLGSRLEFAVDIR